ncbi:MAG: hypothetical protein HY812_16555 [Planctomycetes bacterium]|nr:hypothetical protein [Planctomycetota bacterium]
MIFTELRFLFFFVVVFGVYWALRREGWRKNWLLATSYVFYAGWDWRFLFLIVSSTLVDYVAGWQLAGGPLQKSRGKRHVWLLFSLIANLGLLGFFKYYNFFVDSGARLLQWLGLPASAPALHIILPVGISFYTFQTLSYTLDVYRGKIPVTRNLRDFALFVAFFPQLVAGPIVRAADFLPQFKSDHRLADVRFRACLSLFLFGYIKKACVSDQLAPLVDRVFADPAAFGCSAHWLAVCVFWVQL